MNREELYVLAGWSSNQDGGCMGEFHDPLFHFAYKRADELEELLLKLDHQPKDHIARASVQVNIDLQTSILTYDVSGCCEKCEADVHKVIQALIHSNIEGYRVRLNTTYRQTIEQYMNGLISNLPPVYEYRTGKED